MVYKHYQLKVMNNHLDADGYGIAIPPTDIPPFISSHQINGLSSKLDSAQLNQPLTLRQWRVLWEIISDLQARCARIQHEPWPCLSAQCINTMLSAAVADIARDKSNYIFH
jgi:hypothetical protein